MLNRMKSGFFFQNYNFFFISHLLVSNGVVKFETGVEIFRINFHPIKPMITEILTQSATIEGLKQILLLNQIFLQENQEIICKMNNFRKRV